MFRLKLGYHRWDLTAYTLFLLIMIIGYMTTTLIKFLLAVDRSVWEMTNHHHHPEQDATLQSLIHQCHQVYVKHVMNPWNGSVDGSFSQPITNSPALDARLQAVVDEFHDQRME